MQPTSILGLEMHLAPVVYAYLLAPAKPMFGNGLLVNFELWPDSAQANRHPAQILFALTVLKGA
ncbi:MAG: hypothetical protein WAX89_03475, partial [Alphaproteobacteria bacterium]